MAKNETILKTEILELEVNDIDNFNENQVFHFEVSLFDIEDAKKLIQFIKNNKTKNFIFQCDYGKSRSLSSAIFTKKYILPNHELKVKEQKIRNKRIFRTLFKSYWHKKN